MINLLEDEKIILTRRRHWFVIVAEGGFFLLLGLLPFIALSVTGAISPRAVSFLQDYWSFIVFYSVAWLLILWMIFSVTWTNYYLDVLLVTNKRIVDIEQFGLFARDLAELRLESVQDIKVEVIGLIPSLLKMGDLHIQTAGQAKEIFFKNISDPHKVKHIISTCYDQIVKDESTMSGLQKP